jgi:large-conductance mechanosensitive channel
MEILMSYSAWGYAIVMSAVIIAVIIYTIIKLRKQVNQAEKKEKEKEKRHR